MLDACVLYPFSLRDTLLRLAERELYDPFWSHRILDEMARNLVEHGRMTRRQADRIVSLMGSAFEASEVADHAVAQLEPAMTNHPKDRHVLAAAVAAHAEGIITTNLKDFSPASCAPLGVEAIHPDDFLLGLLSKAPSSVAAELRQQAADLTNPPIHIVELLGMLAAVVPRFAAEVRPLVWG